MKRFSFKAIGIKPGEIIQFSHDTDITAKVVDENFIDFAGEMMSTSGAALKILEAKGNKRVSVRGPSMWRYKGKLLSDIAEELSTRQ